MENKTEKALNDFVEVAENDNEITKNNIQKIILNKREGLIERIDKQYVTNDGRMLLREQY